MQFQIHHRAISVSTNLDAREGMHGDVYTADMQTAGRGRLNHVWHAEAGKNLILSAVFDIQNLDILEVTRFPLVVGLAVANVVSSLCTERRVQLKWPNDIWLDGVKCAGILCERVGDNVIAGVGINVNECEFPDSFKATSLALVLGKELKVAFVRDKLLEELGKLYEIWVSNGFLVLHEMVTKYDALKGKKVLVKRTDEDCEPTNGLCLGINLDGSLNVGGESVFAGEAHIAKITEI